MNESYQNEEFSHDIVVNRRKFTGVHYHDDYELYYLINGKTKYFIADEIFMIESGSFVIIPPGMYHMTDSEDCLHNERILISFKRDIIDDEIIDILDTLCRKRVIYLPAGNREKPEQILARIEDEHINKDENSIFLCSLYTKELIIQLYREYRDYKPKLNASEEVIHNISRYISVNYNKDLSLKSLSRLFAMSESHLSRKFRATLGMGLNEYITYVRILNAENLLKTTALPITNIAEQCGFNDSNYFSTVFKRVKGITPLKFANKFRK